MNLTITQFRGSDYKIFLELIESNMRPYVERHVAEGWRSDLGEKDFQDCADNGRVYSINYNNKFIGFLMLEIQEQTLYVKSIQLKKEFQRKGFGTKLLTYCDKFATDHNCSSLELSVFKDNPAIKLYERNGFKYVKDKINNLILMRKQLTKE